MKRIKYYALSSVFTLCYAGLYAQAPDEINGPAVTGTVTIDFKTRTDVDSAGLPKAGAKDTYTVDLTVAGAKFDSHIKGTITRTPYLPKSSWNFFGTDQRPRLDYDLTVNLISKANPNNKLANFSKIVGAIPLDTTEQTDGGIKYNLQYDLAGTTLTEKDPVKGKLLKVATKQAGTAPSFQDVFGGSILGLQQRLGIAIPKTESSVMAKLTTWKKGQQVADTTARKIDPLKFRSLSLAKGPELSFPGATVSGDFNYEDDTGNWVTQGINVVYSGAGGQDAITGGISYHENENKYEFDLRFNEQAYYANKGKSGDVFAQGNDDADPFAKDPGLPSLLGVVKYEDTDIKDKQGKDIPSYSKVTYELTANKLSSKQIMTFVKLWLLLVGPVNDE